MHQRLGETLLKRAEPGALLAFVATRVRLALDEDGENAVGAAELFEIANLLGDVGGFGGAGRAEDDEILAALDGGADRGREVGVSGQFLFVAKNGEESFGNRVAAFVLGADEAFGDFVGLELLVQPGGPLAAGELGSKTASHRVFGDDFGMNELEEVVGSACF